MHRNRWNSKNNDTSQNRNDQRKKHHRCINHLSAVFTASGKEQKSIPLMLFNALLFGFLISLAERYLG